MIVSEGKFYMDATGRKLGPAKSAPPGNCGYDFVLGGYPYTSDGKCGYISGGVRMCPAEYLDLISEWTDDPQTGTLQELNVKPGDVVEALEEYTSPFMMSIGPVCVMADKSICGIPFDVNTYKWRIISRASTTQSPVRTVTRTSLEIVPGAYGPLNVIANIGGLVSMQIAKEFLTKDEVDELLDNLTAIKEAMEKNQ